MIDLKNLRVLLVEFGIDIKRDPVECPADWKTRVVTEGDFTGCTIRDLILIYCDMTYRKFIWKSKQTAGDCTSLEKRRPE